MHAMHLDCSWWLQGWLQYVILTPVLYLKVEKLAGKLGLLMILRVTSAGEPVKVPSN
jgi:hypothetical protein